MCLHIDRLGKYSFRSTFSAILRLWTTSHETAPYAQHLKDWLEMMKADSRAIFTAAARAQEAVTFLTSLQPKPEWL
jgi:antirestriction protein ArdC